MKKVLAVSALLATVLMAQDYKYEISPMVGYNFAEGNLGMKHNGYGLGGLEFQRNYENSKISPEFSFFYAPKAKYDSIDEKTNILRGAFNGVYSFSKSGMFRPFVKAGLGLENFTSNRANNNDGIFADAGAGAKVAFTDSLALKLEAIYSAKLNTDHAGHADSNLMTLVGLTYSFGAVAPKAAPKPEPVAKPTPAPVVVPVNVDSDGDGVFDKMDKCPNTPANTKVDANGCKVVLDHDGDGVLDADDLCPNTPKGEKVDSHGCPEIVNLHINFNNDKATILPSATAQLDKFAAFLKRNQDYSAKIVGFTDSKGSAKYNQKLSEKRANAVMQALIKRGVSASQLSAIGMGELNPVATNATAEGRAQNRRIEADLTRK